MQISARLTTCLDHWAHWVHYPYESPLQTPTKLTFEEIHLKQILIAKQTNDFPKLYFPNLVIWKVFTR